MAQDLGSAILAGIQGVQEGARQRQAMLMQQQELELAKQRGEREQRQLDLYSRNVESEISKRDADLQQSLRTNLQTRVKQEGDSLVGQARTSGYFDVNDRQNPFKKDKLIADLKDPAKRPMAEQILVRMANHERSLGRLDENNLEQDDFQFTGLDQEALAQGKVVVVGRYKSTGEPGVSTVGGTNRPDDPVYARDFTDAANDIGVYFRGSLLDRGSNMGASSAYTRSVIAAEASEFDQKQSTTFGNNTLIRQVLPASSQLLGREGGRAALAAISATEGNPEEQRKVLLGIAETLNRRGANIQVPAWMQKKPADRDKEIIEPQNATQKPTADASRFNLAGDPGQRGATAVATLLGVDAKEPTLADIENRIKRKISQANAATGDKRIQLERELSELQASRTAQVKRINKAGFNSIETELSALKADRAKAAPDRRAAFDKKIGELESRRGRYVQAGYTTPAMETEQYQEFQGRVLDKIQNLSAEEALALVQEGRIQFTDADRAAMMVRAQEAGVTSNAQIKKLPYKEQIALRSMMYAWSDNPAERESIRDEMSNLATTGILSMSKKDLDTSNRQWFDSFTNRGVLELNRAKFIYDQWNDQQNRLAKSLETGDNWRKEVREIQSGYNQMLWYGKGPGGVEIDDKGYTGKLDMDRVKGATRFYLPNLILDTRQAIAAGNGRRHLQAVNSITSTALAAVAENGTGGFFNWIASLARPSASGVVGAGTDFDLSRFRPEYDASGDITGFYYTTESGKAAGRFFTAQQVQEGLDPELFEVLVSAVKLHEQARKKEED
jgi:hypothetical protein